MKRTEEREKGQKYENTVFYHHYDIESFLC